MDSPIVIFLLCWLGPLAGAFALGWVVGNGYRIRISRDLRD